MSQLDITRTTPAERFNATRFSRFVNGRSGRLFRLVAGTAFLLTGLDTLSSPVGVGLALWSVLPLGAAVFDVCWISGALGGPLSGARIRASR